MKCPADGEICIPVVSCIPGTFPKVLETSNTNFDANNEFFTSKILFIQANDIKYEGIYSLIHVNSLKACKVIILYSMHITIIYFEFHL